MFLYSEGSSQSALKFDIGPVLTLGSYKKKFLDYTQISTKYSYVIKGGESPFKFDSIDKDPRIKLSLKQQLYGPLILKSKATINLDSDSSNYGDFISSRISLNWKKRSYEFGIFYQPHNQAGGISLNLFGFN